MYAPAENPSPRRIAAVRRVDRRLAVGAGDLHGRERVLRPVRAPRPARGCRRATGGCRTSAHGRARRRRGRSRAPALPAAVSRRRPRPRSLSQLGELRVERRERVGEVRGLAAVLLDDLGAALARKPSFDSFLFSRSSSTATFSRSLPRRTRSASKSTRPSSDDVDLARPGDRRRGVFRLRGIRARPRTPDPGERLHERRLALQQQRLGLRRLHHHVERLLRRDLVAGAHGTRPTPRRPEAARSSARRPRRRTSRGPRRRATRRP